MEVVGFVFSIGTKGLRDLLLIIHRYWLDVSPESGRNLIVRNKGRSHCGVQRRMVFFFASMTCKLFVRCSLLLLRCRKLFVDDRANDP